MDSLSFSDLTIFDGIVTVTIDVSSLGVADLLLPDKYDLHQNYPNPFNPITKIKYDLPEFAHVRLVIYNLLGQEIRTLVNEMQAPGFKQVHWDSKDVNGHLVGSGLYIYRIQSKKFIHSRKMIMVK